MLQEQEVWVDRTSLKRKQAGLKEYKIKLVKTELKGRKLLLNEQIL